MTRIAAVTVFLSIAILKTSGAHAEQKFTPLFDGRSLEGWTVLRCEAGVDEGAILLKAGDGVVHTNKQYGDFVLELEWKAARDKGYDSGIYFRCDLPKGNRPWPARYQANLRQGQEGNVGGVKGASSKGLIKVGEWNHFRLSVIGPNVAMEINGKPAYKVDGIQQAKGYICLQAEIPGGGQFRFRNIKIAEPE
jgi:hypothetical protein